MSVAGPSADSLQPRGRRRAGMSMAEACLLGQRVTSQQFFWMALTVRATTAVALLPVLTGSRAGRDAWLAFLLSVVPGAVLAWFIASPATRWPGRGFVSLARAAFGKRVGTAVTLLFLAGYLVATSVILREYAEAIVTVILPTTPLVVVISVVAFLAAVTAAQETPAVGRLALLIGPIVVGSVFIIGLLASPALEPGRLLPVLSTGWSGVTSGVLAAMVWNTQYILYYPLAAAAGRADEARTALVASSAAAAALLGTLVAVLTITALTAELAVHEAFPLFEVARLVSVGEFVQRIDAVAAGAWGLGLILSSSLFFHAAALGMSELLGLPQHRMLVKPMGVVLVVVAMRVAHDTLELRNLTDVRVLTPYAAVLAWLPVVAWAVLAAWRAPGRPGHQPQQP